MCWLLEIGELWVFTMCLFVFFVGFGDNRTEFPIWGSYLVLVEADVVYVLLFSDLNV